MALQFHSRPGAALGHASIGVAVLALLSACGGGGGSGTVIGTVATPAEACAALVGFDIKASSIGLATSGASIKTATLVAASASGSTNGEYCAVTGFITPVSASAPSM